MMKLWDRRNKARLGRDVQRAHEEILTPSETELLLELRRQWAESGRRDTFDFDFAEFSSALRIIMQLQDLEFRRLPSARAGMTHSEGMILRALRRTPNQALRQTDLSKRLLATSGAMTKQINRLEASGLIERDLNKEGKRGWLVKLTDKGREVVDGELMNHRLSHPVTNKALNSLPKGDREELLRLLRAVVENIREQTGLSFGTV